MIPCAHQYCWQNELTTSEMILVGPRVLGRVGNQRFERFSFDNESLTESESQICASIFCDSSNMDAIMTNIVFIFIFIDDHHQTGQHDQQQW